MVRRRRLIEGALAMTTPALLAHPARALSIETLTAGSPLALAISDRCSVAEAPDHQDIKRRLLDLLRADHAAAGTARSEVCPICGCRVTVTAGS